MTVMRYMNILRPLEQRFERSLYPDTTKVTKERNISHVTPKERSDIARWGDFFTCVRYIRPPTTKIIKNTLYE